MAQINPPRTLTNEPRGYVSTADDAPGLPTNRGQEFFEDHRTAILGVIGGLVALAVLVFAWRAYQANRSEEGQVLLGAILTEYEAGNYQTALDGTDAAPGLLDIADEYGSTPTGQQATFFAADALYQTGETDRALELFEDYSGPPIMEASAIAGRAAIAEDAGQHAQAADLYERAAGAFESPASTPGYLLDAARTHRAAGETDAAMAALERVVDEYPDTPEARTANAEIGLVMAAASASGTATGTVRPAPVVADSTAAVETAEQ